MPNPPIPKKKRVVESLAHREIRNTLRRIAMDINKDLTVHEFNQEQLKSLGIRVDRMALDETSPHKKPSYFAPYPAHLLTLDHDEEEEILQGKYNGIDGENYMSLTDPSGRAHTMDIHLRYHINHSENYCEEERTPWTSKCIGDYLFMNGLYKSFPPAYGCSNTTDLDGSTHPHVKAVMWQGLVAKDSTILRGELSPIVEIMISQFLQTRFVDHMVAPVLIISLMGFKARVIEAYFKDQTLILRPSEMLDFTHANNAGFKTFVQWYLGPPIGDTS
ncbi:hypothetical protein GX50_02163 [[Emmonsia] crescens]|uniref:Uncharacterized protein n=1 Tax=[Emmonsia] crescens TaxID=73230 RepID=A0A2B7ZPC0_9EURO|nr:hypothetical protein GX50_02163 [Emmonsia crescens]